MMKVCYLVRHAESAPAAALPETDWPLTESGAVRAAALVPVLVGLGIGIVHSSPYRRAIDTVAPFAAAASLEVRVVAGLRERKLTPEFVDDFQGAARRAWRDFDFAPQGCESSGECRSRMLATVGALMAESNARIVLLSSHGNAIGLLLNGLTGGRFGYEDWRAMPRPALFRVLVREGGVLSLDEEFRPRLG